MTRLQSRGYLGIKYNVNGCVTLLKADDAYEALLLEALIPGTPLSNLYPAHDLCAVEHDVQVMKLLHSHSPQSSTYSFQTMLQWLELFETINAPDTLKPHIAQARLIAHKLRKTQGTEYVLHGDLHHENILLGKDGWKALDPKGVIGEPAYDVGAFLTNPPELCFAPNLPEILAHRLNALSLGLSLDRDRIKDASYVRIILSACWSVQEHTDWEHYVRCAELVQRV